MSFFITFFISRSFSVCLYPQITNPSEFEFFVQVRSREYIDCSQVKGQLTVPSNCIIIGDESFCNCTGLYGNLVFEDRMERIGKNAFLNTNFLRVIYKGSDVPNCTQESLPDNIPIYVSDTYKSTQLCGRDVQVEDLDQLLQESIIELTDPPTPLITEPPSIQTTEISSEFTSEMTLPISSEEEPTQIITEIITRPTEAPTNICKHIDINDTKQLNLSLLKIDKNEYAFCSQIKGKLELPQSLTSIGSSAFYQCSGLTDSLEIPKNVETVDDNAFDGCNGLNGYLVIDSEIKRIGKGAFNSTHFDKIFYNGKFEPSCGEKPFPDGQIIHTTQNYQNDTFCGYQIEMEISENSISIDNSKSKFIESTFEFNQTDFIQNSEESEKLTLFSMEFESPSEIIIESEFQSESGQITFEPQITEKSKKKKKLSSGAVVAIIIACVVFVIAVVALLIYFCSIRGKNPLEKQLTSNTLTDIYDV